MRFVRWFGVALSCAGLFGCSGAEPKQGGGSAKLPDPGADGEYSVDWPELGHGADRYIVVDMGPDSLESCRHVSPKFPFDSAKTRAQDQAQLKALASCLNHPTMIEKTVLLVGRTDATGSVGYNSQLGTKRAAAIRALLIKSGLDPARIHIATGGESNAVGDQVDYSKGYDRRVDVVITGGAHAP